MQHRTRIAIIGANASGLYCLDQLMCQHDVEVDLIDSVPAPLGITALHQASTNTPSSVRVIGNVTPSKKVLDLCYDAVIHTESNQLNEFTTQALIDTALYAAKGGRPQAIRFDLVEYLTANHIPHTIVRGALALPNYTLQQWQAHFATAQGAPVCF